MAKPSALVFVDKDYMKSLGYPASPLWDGESIILSAPLEVHAAITNQCNAGCRFCYTDSTSNTEQPRLGIEKWKSITDELARIRVFHMALGGGESFEESWFIDLANYVQEKKIVPNLTTNGFLITPAVAYQCRKIFGQINISLDGPQEIHNKYRGNKGFEAAFNGLKLLLEAGCKAGINCVVHRFNFEHLESLIALASKVGVNQVELLRFKPAGRGAEVFKEYDLTSEQAVNLYHVIRNLIKKYRITIRLDCSFTPMICWHNPDKKRMDKFGIAGCLGGDMLMGIRSNGKVCGCSFTPSEDLDPMDINKWWAAPSTFAEFRKLIRNYSYEPCCKCRYLDLCHGGCHAVSLHESGNFDLPDPGCPKVRIEGGYQS